MNEWRLYGNMEACCFFSLLQDLVLFLLHHLLWCVSANFIFAFLTSLSRHRFWAIDFTGLSKFFQAQEDDLHLRETWGWCLYFECSTRVRRKGHLRAFSQSYSCTKIWTCRRTKQDLYCSLLHSHIPGTQ